MPLHRLSDADWHCLSRIGACPKRIISHALGPAKEVHQDGRERCEACPLVLQRLRNAALCLRFTRSTHLFFTCRLLGATQSSPTAEANLVSLIIALVGESKPYPESRSPVNSVCIRHQMPQVAYRILTPNPSIERTRSGGAGLAFISFWAKPAPPALAAHVKR